MKMLILSILLVCGVAWSAGKSGSPREKRAVEEPVLVEEVLEDIVETVKELNPNNQEKKREKPVFTKSAEEKKGTREIHPQTTYTSKKGSQSNVHSVEEACIYTHNQLRERHGVTPLTYNTALADQAQEHSNWMASELTLEYSGERGYGEVIAQKSINKRDTVFGPSEIIIEMYNEMIDPGYDFDAHHGEGTQQFQQIVWANTTEIGCGMTSVSDGIWDITFLCCQYVPAGNVKNENEHNVFRPAEIHRATAVEADLDQGGDYWRGCDQFNGRRCNSQEAKACQRSCSH